MTLHRRSFLHLLAVAAGAPAVVRAQQPRTVRLRGTGEGHDPFDFLPQSTMTHATVADVAKSPDGEKLELRYKDGRNTIIVPPEAPIASLVRVNAGRNGFSPPY